MLTFPYEFDRNLWLFHLALNSRGENNRMNVMTYNDDLFNTAI